MMCKVCNQELKDCGSESCKAVMNDQMNYWCFKGEHVCEDC